MNKFPIEPFIHHSNSKLNINCKSVNDVVALRGANIIVPHKISFYAIHLFEEGIGHHSLDNHTFEVRPKHILIGSKNQISQFHEPVSYSGKILIFTEDFFCLNDIHFQFLYNSLLLNNVAEMSYFDVSARYDELLVLFDLIEQELDTHCYPKQQQVLNNYLFSILLILDNIFHPYIDNLSIQKERLIVSKFKNLVNNNTSKENTIKKYAANLGLSVRTIENAFKKIENKTPYLWFSEQLILKIKRSLIYKNVHINEVAYELGFKEANHLIKFFKKHTGLTPLQFRKSHLSDNIKSLVGIGYLCISNFETFYYYSSFSSLL